MDLARSLRLCTIEGRHAPAESVKLVFTAWPACSSELRPLGALWQRAVHCEVHTKARSLNLHSIHRLHCQLQLTPSHIRHRPPTPPVAPAPFTARHQECLWGSQQHSSMLALRRATQRLAADAWAAGGLECSTSGRVAAQAAARFSAAAAEVEQGEEAGTRSTDDGLMGRHLGHAPPPLPAATAAVVECACVPARYFKPPYLQNPRW